MATEAVAEEIMMDWLESEEGRDCSEEKATAKMDEILMRVGDKTGIYLCCDGAWQKRSLGKHTMNSTTGHNFGLGAYKLKICSLAVFSQHCRLHEYYEKQGKEVPPHRCSRNFSLEDSAKKMASRGDALAACYFEAILHEKSAHSACSK